MDRWKNRGGKGQRREDKKREDQRRERVRTEKIQVREEVGKSRSTVICGSGGLKCRLTKAAGVETSGEIR